MHSPDFPYALFGLPFDCVCLQQTKTLIRQAIKTGQQLIIATPNVNFVSLAVKDKDFRQSIVECDLSIIDGTPLFWLLRWLQAPHPEKVPGSSLIESLIADSTEPPIKVFFFGGQDDAAMRASQVLNKNRGGIISVGACNPGFGSIETMSSEDIINQINAAGPDFLIVSLGAQKGHKWIQRNKHRLHAPVISHLGAVVNFVAGTKKRSPHWLQKLGLEWLWRIYQEPALFKRYASDALTLATLMLKHYYPAFIAQMKYKPVESEQGRFEMQIKGSHITYSLIGQLCEPYTGKLLQSLQQLNPEKGNTLQFDMSQTTFVDSQMAGAIVRMQGICAQNSASLIIEPLSPVARKALQNFMIAF